MGLTKLGHDVTIVTSYDSKRKTPDDNVKVVQFKVGGKWNPRTILNPFIKVFYGDIKGYREYIANFSGDVIMFHTTTLWNTDTVLDILPKIPAKSILISHGVSFNSGSFIRRLAWRPYLWRLYKIYNTFDHIVFTQNNVDKYRFYDKYIMEKRKFLRWSVIPNGSYPEVFHSKLPDFRKSLNIAPDKKLILCVGSYSPIKNQKMVIHAFAKARRDDALLILIGSECDKNYLSSLKKIVASLFQDPLDVLFLFDLEPSFLYSAYQSASIFINGSHTDVQPLVILEAMASRSPFISTNVGIVSELPGGIIVSSVEEMAQKINYLLENPHKHSELSQLGRSAVLGLYNWDKVASMYENLIERLIFH